VIPAPGVKFQDWQEKFHFAVLEAVIDNDRLPDGDVNLRALFFDPPGSSQREFHLSSLEGIAQGLRMVLAQRVIYRGTVRWLSSAIVTHSILANDAISKSTRLRLRPLRPLR